MNKKECRALLQNRWKQLSPAELKQIEDDTARTIWGSEEWNNCGTVLAYLAFSGEISLDSLILKSLEKGKKVFVPRIRDRGIMTFHGVKDLNPSSLELNRWNIRETPAGAPLFQPRAAEKVLLLTPGLGFTLGGKRMGRGGGFYDRYLAGIEGKAEIVTMGIAWKGIILPELPTDAYDRTVRTLCREDEIIDCQDLN